jgi:hypothetical protein
VKGKTSVLAAGLLAACALVGFAAAFGLAGKAGAASPGQTTVPTTTSTQPPVEPPPVEPTPAPIAFGVTVGGVRVGGLMPFQASKAVTKAYTRPLRLVVDPARTIELAPSALDARANVPKAIRRARLARPGAIVPLDVDVSQARVRQYVEKLGDGVDREALDARVVLDGLKPKAVKAQVGLHLRRLAAGRSIRTALAVNSRAAIRLPFDRRMPEVRSTKLDEAIVIMRASNKLLFFDSAKYDCSFGVATGQAAYPTPLGTYEVVTLQRDPWWYPPPSPWAKDSQPVPPGPGNPLGTRWMGLSAPYVGIHGTPDAASIGYSASHGCIRMRIPDAEWLFQHVKVGTPVFIVNR